MLRKKSLNTKKSPKRAFISPNSLNMYLYVKYDFVIANYKMT